MNKFQIGGLAIGALIALIGSVKIELLKEIARKVTSDKEKVNIYSIFLLVFIAVIPAIIGFSVSSSDQSDTPPPPTEEKDDRPKSDAEVGLDAAKDAVVLTNEMIEKADEQRAEKEKEYEASRGKRWFYQIGDWTDERNKDALLDMFKQLEGIGISNICVFQDGSKVVLFRNEEHGKEELDASLNDFKTHVGSGVSVSIVNLMEHCTYKHPDLVNSKSLKLRKKKEKREIPCYICH